MYMPRPNGHYTAITQRAILSTSCSVDVQMNCDKDFYQVCPNFTIVLCMACGGGLTIVEIAKVQEIY